MSKTSSNGEYIFVTADPIGREVRLKASTWEYHITGGDHSRTEFDGEEQKVENVIKDPRFILEDDSTQSSNMREKYVDLIDLESMSTLKTLAIVVDHENPEYGDIVTIIAKSRSNEKGGTIYDRGSTTNQ